MVHSVDFYGHDARVLVDLPAGLQVAARLDGADLPAHGQQVALVVTGAALAFPTAGATVPESVPAS